VYHATTYLHTLAAHEGQFYACLLSMFVLCTERRRSSREKRWNKNFYLLNFQPILR